MARAWPHEWARTALQSSKNRSAAGRQLAARDRHRHLAAELAASEAMRSDVERLKAMPKFMSRGGGPSNKVMEDIWLGSLLHRAPPARPLTYVALEEYLTGVFVSDGWGLKVRDGTPPR